MRRVAAKVHYTCLSMRIGYYTTNKNQGQTAVQGLVTIRGCVYTRLPDTFSYKIMSRYLNMHNYNVEGYFLQ